MNNQNNNQQQGGFSPYILAQMIAPGNIQQPGLYPAGNQPGDIYYGADGIHFNRLGVGTNGQVLTVASNLPSWQTLPTQGATLIATKTASASSTIDFTSIANTTYMNYRLIGSAITPSNNAVTLSMRMSVAGSFKSGSTDYEHRQFRFTSAASGITGADTASSININSASDTLANTGTGEGMGFDMTIFNCSQTTTVKRVVWHAHYLGSAYLDLMGGGAYLTAANAVDGFRILISAGTIATGTFSLYGFS